MVPINAWSTRVSTAIGLPPNGHLITWDNVARGWGPGSSYVCFTAGDFSSFIERMTPLSLQPSISLVFLFFRVRSLHVESRSPLLRRRRRRRRCRFDARPSKNRLQRREVAAACSLQPRTHVFKHVDVNIALYIKDRLVIVARSSRTTWLISDDVQTVQCI